MTSRADAESAGLAHPSRRTLRIPLEGSGSLEADLYVPRDTPAPTVIMGHGLGAERAFGLDDFARVLQREGYAVLTIDYRGFGGSDGQPRLLVDGRRHAEDLERAFDFAATLPEVDGDRRALWGVSFAGGHVVSVAAGRTDVRAVVALVPHLDRLRAVLRYPLRHLPRALWLGVRDGLRAARGAEELRVPLIQPEGFAVLTTPDAFEGYRELLPDGVHWDRRVPARVFLGLLRYRPGRNAHRVTCPALLQAAEDDLLIPLEGIRRAARRMPRARLETYPIGHFDPYREPWKSRLIDSQLTFLREHLAMPREDG